MVVAAINGIDAVPTACNARNTRNKVKSSDTAQPILAAIDIAMLGINIYLAPFTSMSAPHPICMIATIKMKIETDAFTIDSDT
ncbi:hypothetical protein PBN151_5089 [Paenibacillus sp. NAIST15-1]|nr:hypothetical protein PBN151_5089 [Paenibacillus sp. NAIST15-1]